MKPGTPKLSDTARQVVAPSGIVSTGWPAVEDTCRTKLGLTFDPWQNQSGRLALAKRADGKLAATIGGVGMSICRQAGKTHWLTGLVFGVSINRPNTLTVWSAHHAKTHGETFLAMGAFAERQRVAPYIEQVYKGSGDEEVRFRNGSRILFGAREHGFGRGIPGVDIIVADEAQIMSERAVDAMIATMNTSDFGLAFYIGTPPRPEDNSESFTRMRTEAWDGTLEDAVWIEFGAEPGADPNSAATWSRANPSYPHRTPRESMLRLQRKLSPESFLREGLGIWSATATSGAIDTDLWNDARIDPPETDADPADERIAFGAYTNLQRTRSAIGAATYTDEGAILVEVVPAADGVEYTDLPGTSWIPPRVHALSEKWSPVACVVDGYSAAASLLPDMEELGLDITVTQAKDMARACGMVYDALVEGRLKHLGQIHLTKAALSAKWRELSDSRAWDRKDKSSDVTDLVAITLAVYGLITRGGEPKEVEVWGFYE